jgi:hypothetical protein
MRRNPVKGIEDVINVRVVVAHFFIAPFGIFRLGRFEPAKD